MSAVAADEWADWSLLPLSSEAEEEGKMTVELEREQEEDGKWGSVLRISLVDGKGVRMMIRQITWVFHDLDEESVIEVGVFVAKPTVDDIEELKVDFEGFEIVYRE